MAVQYTGDEQLTRVSYFKDGDTTNPVYEGLAPVQYKADRTNGLRWVELRDAAKAEQEASQAEQDAAAASTTAGPDPLDLIADLESQLAESRAALEAVQQTQSTLQLATPDAVIQGAAQIARVSGLAADIEARSTAHAQQAQALVDGVIAKQAELETKIGELAATAGALQADTREQVTSLVADTTRKVAAAISKRIVGFELAASKLRGPKGNTGNNGASVAVVPGEPNKLSPDQLEARFRRAPQAGDNALQQINTGWAWWVLGGDSRWTRAAVLERDVQAVATQLGIVDQSTKVQSQTTNIKAGGGGGLERFQVAQVNPGTTRIADAGGWVVGTSGANQQDPESGILEVELLPLGGGESYRFSSVFKWDAATAALGGAETTSSILGQLPGGSDYEILISRGSVVVPGGITATAPAGAVCTIVELRITGTESYLLRGGIEWLMSSDPKALSPTDAAQQPAWRFD